MQRKESRFLLLWIILLSLLAAWGVSSLWKIHKAEKGRLDCYRNLREVGQALHIYASEHEGRFPTVSRIKNNFMFDRSEIFPKYLPRAEALICPSCPSSRPGSLAGDSLPRHINDQTYCYLGWVQTSDIEAEAFFEAYDTMSPEEYDKEIKVAEGQGNPYDDPWYIGTSITNYGDVIYRLERDVGHRMTDVKTSGSGPGMVEQLPVMWDRGPYHIDGIGRSKRRGGHVLYLDGHVEFVEWGEKFPMTDTFAELLNNRVPQAFSGHDKN